MHLQAKRWNTSYLTRLVGCKGKEAAVARSFAFVWLPWSSCIYSADLCAEWLVWKMSDIQVIDKAALLWFKLCVCVKWCVFWSWQPLLSQSLILSCLHIIRWKGPFLYEYVRVCFHTPLFSTTGRPWYLCQWLHQGDLWPWDIGIGNASKSKLDGAILIELGLSSPLTKSTMFYSD